MDPREFQYAEEQIENFQQKCTCVLVLDTSGSMDGEPINELNGGLAEFYKEILGDPTTKSRLEIGIVTFDQVVKSLQEPALVSNFTMPTLAAQGTTKLVDGVREGINMVKARKKWYKETDQPFYRPWIILITDGIPDDGQDFKTLGDDIRREMKAKHYNFFAIAVKGADVNLLREISDPSMAPAQLKGTRFIEFFKWLSASMDQITQSAENDKIKLNSPTSWIDDWFEVD